MSDIVYAVHTRSCTYLLDEDGFCKWVLSRSGARSEDRCVGAQFVAALDLHSKGGLVGELRIGASALFIRSEEGRFVLIRTKPIEHVEIRGAASEADPYAPQADPYAPQADPYAPQADPYAAHAAQADAYAAYASYASHAAPQDDPEAVVLPSHHAVAGVFQAPAPAPEPAPASEQRVIVSSAYGTATYPEAPPPHYAPPAPPASYPPAHTLTPEDGIAPPPPLRSAPSSAAAPAPPQRARPRGHTEPPPPPAPPAIVQRPRSPSHLHAHLAPPQRRPCRRLCSGCRLCPRREPHPRACRAPVAPLAPRRGPGDPAAPPHGPLAPQRPSRRLAPMLAPPPPQAELLPLGPARPDLPPPRSSTSPISKRSARTSRSTPPRSPSRSPSSAPTRARCTAGSAPCGFVARRPPTRARCTAGSAPCGFVARRPPTRHAPSAHGPHRPLHTSPRGRPPSYLKKPPK
ncbi:MAG: hypothetical protein R3B70_24655 [Polyangiaceae bacterium]